MTDQLQIEGPATKTRRSRKNGVAKVERNDVAPVADNTAMFSAIERIMVDPNASVERAEQAFAFYQKVEADRARKEFDAAMAAAKADLPPIVKGQHVSYTNRSGDVTEYDHESLADIAEVVDPILAAHGLSYRYRTTSNPNEPITCTCILSHRTGHAEENTLSAAADNSGGKNSIQAIGSTVQYLMRYTLKASLGLSVKKRDDDGRAADEKVGDLITDAQADEILELLALTNSQPAPFLTWAKVENVSDIKASDFKNVVAMLKKKLANMQQEGANDGH